MVEACPRRGVGGIRREGGRKGEKKGRRSAKQQGGNKRQNEEEGYQRSKVRDGEQIRSFGPGVVEALGGVLE